MHLVTQQKQEDTLCFLFASLTSTVSWCPHKILYLEDQESQYTKHSLFFSPHFVSCRCATAHPVLFFVLHRWWERLPLPWQLGKIMCSVTSPEYKVCDFHIHRHHFSKQWNHTYAMTVADPCMWCMHLTQCCTQISRGLHVSNIVIHSSICQLPVDNAGNTVS